MDHYLSAVQRALEFIEARLTEPITLAAIARRAGFSPWHFQRIFQAYMGETLAAYLRRRRLSVAVNEIRNTRRRILDIALDYQFGTHAAFTRAFKATFQAAPRTFRREHRPLPAALAQPVASPPAGRYFPMKPTLRKLPALTFIGLEARFFGPMSPDCNNHKVIPPLFNRFFARTSELPPGPEDACTYGLTRCAPAPDRIRDDELVYLAARRAAPRTPVPAGMARWKLAAQTYAVFTHCGPVVRVDDTFTRIYREWLPQSGHEPVGEGSLECYEHTRFGDGGPKSEFDIFIPVRPRRK